MGIIPYRALRDTTPLAPLAPMVKVWRAWELPLSCRRTALAPPVHLTLQGGVAMNPAAPEKLPFFLRYAVLAPPAITCSHGNSGFAAPRWNVSPISRGLSIRAIQTIASSKRSQTHEPKSLRTSKHPTRSPVSMPIHARKLPAESVAEGDRELAACDRYRGELSCWLRPNIGASCDGIPGRALGLGTWRPPLPLTSVRRMPCGDLVRKAPSIVVLGTGEDTVESWMNAGYPQITVKPRPRPRRGVREVLLPESIA
jgi:hypothetical protein